MDARLVEGGWSFTIHRLLVFEDVKGVLLLKTTRNLSLDSSSYEARDACLTLLVFYSVKFK